MEKITVKRIKGKYYARLESGENVRINDRFARNMMLSDGEVWIAQVHDTKRHKRVVLERRIGAPPAHKLRF